MLPYCVRPLAAVASMLALYGCSTVPPAYGLTCPQPPAALLQRMPPLPPIPTSLDGSPAQGGNTKSAGSDSTP